MDSVSFLFEGFPLIIKHLFKSSQIVLHDCVAVSEGLDCVGQLFVFKGEVGDVGLPVCYLFLFEADLFLEFVYLFLKLAVLLDEGLQCGHLLLEVSFPVLAFLHLSLIDSDGFPAPADFFNSLVDPLIELVGIGNDILHLLPAVANFNNKSLIILSQLLDIVVFIFSFPSQLLNLFNNVVDIVLDVVVESSFLLNLFLGVVELLLILGHSGSVVFYLLLIVLQLSFLIDYLVSDVLELELQLLALSLQIVEIVFELIVLVVEILGVLLGHLCS